MCKLFQVFVSERKKKEKVSKRKKRLPLRQTSAVDFGVSDVKSTRLLVCCHHSPIVARPVLLAPPVIWTVDSSSGPASDAYALENKEERTFDPLIKAKAKAKANAVTPWNLKP